jgi:MOSC domain-containing protein YiiM
MQITIMNSRLITLIAGKKERWPIAGDQLFVDLDLSVSNLPIGSRLKINEAVVEITAAPHTGCGKFKARFGADALAFVNSKVGLDLRLRGANARIIKGGVIQVGNVVAKL